MPDGSRVELNTDTAIEAAVDDRSRAIWLVRGEAYFDVAKQPGRQFVIYSGPRTITVLGTKFSVRRTRAELTVAVLEGVVQVAEGTAERSVTVTAGNVAVADEGSTLVTRGSLEAVQDLLAWRSGRLRFEGTTLAQAAGQFNRYNRKQLVIEDAARPPKCGSAAVFEARNVDAFEQLLRDAYGLNVEARGGTITVSS